MSAAPEALTRDKVTASPVEGLLHNRPIDEQGHVTGGQKCRPAGFGTASVRETVSKSLRAQKPGTTDLDTLLAVLETSGDLDPLAPEPAILTGTLVGYARVSTKAQLLDRQIHAPSEAGCIRIFSDKKSGRNAEREELWKALDYLRPGDTLVVPSLDRLGRSIQDLIALVSGLRKRGVGFTSLHENLDTTTPGGRLVFHVFAVLAVFIRELIVQGTNEGLDVARARGARPGRPAAMTPEQIRHERDLLTRPENTVVSIAELLGVSRNTIYKYVPELKEGRPALAGASALPRPTEPHE
jgi:DNA invertase Pin-like site-specific DNA recombinase